MCTRYGMLAALLYVGTMKTDTQTNNPGGTMRKKLESLCMFEDDEIGAIFSLCDNLYTNGYTMDDVASVAHLLFTLTRADLEAIAAA